MTGLHKGSRKGPIVDINMVPMIDVVLVLLIIFMVMTPFLVQQQVGINLPQAATGQEAPDRPIIVLLERDGGLQIGGRAVSASLLETELRSALGKDAQRPVVIQADKDAPLQRVISVMDVARRLKVGKLGITVEQPK